MSTLDIFNKRKESTRRIRATRAHAPLSDRMRPEVLEDVVGQGHLVGEGEMLWGAIVNDEVASMIFWGPPGCGKTTLAHVIACGTAAHFEKMSAVFGGVGEIRKVVKRAEELLARHGQRTILFIDEIHRFSKVQQDALLPHVEAGTLVLIGATTENPCFAVTNALLSRTGVVQLKPLDDEGIRALLGRALRDEERGLGSVGVALTSEALEAIVRHAQGDGRRALDCLEGVVRYALSHSIGVLDKDRVEKVLSARVLWHDKQGEGHYNLTSALIKSMRGSDPDAAIYWMMRLLEGGDDPLFLLRRMMIFASEDIGNADPEALQVAVAADTAFQRLGMPEGIYPLAHCCIYLACAPKSNACYKAFVAAQGDVKRHGHLPVPIKLRNAVTQYMKAWGYGEKYRYPHNEAGYAVGETYLPEGLVGKVYYDPTAFGVEAIIKKRLEGLRGRDKGKA